ncbi:hypothetical protein DC357_14720 [Vibrio vulnificus]|nr:hypothetical protein DC357_14720 [Vibrio vulnificus]
MTQSCAPKRFSLNEPNSKFHQDKGQLLGNMVILAIYLSITSSYMVQIIIGKISMATIAVRFQRR